MLAGLPLRPFFAKLEVDGTSLKSTDKEDKKEKKKKKALADFVF